MREIKSNRVSKRDPRYFCNSMKYLSYHASKGYFPKHELFEDLICSHPVPSNELYCLYNIDLCAMKYAAVCVEHCFVVLSSVHGAWYGQDNGFQLLLQLCSIPNRTAWLTVTVMAVSGRIRLSVSTANRTYELSGINHVTPFCKYGKHSTGPSTLGVIARG